MTYIRKEELPARHIGNRLIPPLTKYYRADGSFDLFDMAYAPCSLQWLCQNNYAGFMRIKCNGQLLNDCSFGTYDISGGCIGTISTLGVNDPGSGGNYSGRAETSVLKVKFDNPLGLTPVYIYIYSSRETDDDNAGTTVLRLYDYNNKLLVDRTGGRASSQTWDVRSTFPPDYKDTYYIWAGVGSRGSGKFPSSRVVAEYRFVTRLPYCNDEIYRLYS